MRGFEDWNEQDVLKHNERIKKATKTHEDCLKPILNTKPSNLSSENKNRLEIPLKLPSLNEYINACRNNKFAGAKMKKDIEEELSVYINKLPKFEKPIKINFTWVEANKKRDLDNICFAKKFILDTMQKCGKLENDNRKWVTAFTDSFEYSDVYKVILNIEEVK